MISHSKLDEIKSSGHLPSPSGVALQVIRLTQKDDVTNQEIAQAIKADPALTGRVIKAANVLVAYQTRPIASILDAVSVLGFNTIKQLVLGLSLIENNREGVCHKFDYQDFWAHSLLTAIAAQNLVLHSGIGSIEEVFILGLLGQIGSLALATAQPDEYAKILGSISIDDNSGLINLERAEFGFDHNQLTQSMLADWGMPRVFQEVVLFHEDPTQSKFVENSRDWRLLNVLHISECFSKVCLAQEPLRHKMVPNLILAASRSGVELSELAKIGDKSVHEWQEWSKLCNIRSAEVPPFAKLLEAAPLVPSMLEVSDDLLVSGTFYRLRILLVEDDRATLLLVKTLLENVGHTVVTANNGVEGLGMIDQFMPQLIITDWVMAPMDGIEFCKTLRKSPAWQNIYVFIMTGQEGKERLVEAFEAGANDYINKPVNSKVLVARLRAAQRVVQLQEEMKFDQQQLHKFADELSALNHRLRKNEVSMRAILDNSPYMTWLKDTEGRYIRVNKAYVDYFRGRDVSQVIGKTDFDLWPHLLANKYQNDDAEVMTTRQQKRTEESLLEGDKIYWIEIFKTPVIDENGKVLGITGFARDITERKQSEAEIRIAATAFESTEGIMITDSRRTILRVNNAFTTITGYSSEEAIGKNPRLLSSGHHDANFYVAMWNCINRTGSWEGEIWNRRKNGEVYPQRLKITAVKDKSDTVTNYVATLADLTVNRDAANEIQHLAYYDLLTRLPNRRLLIDRLNQAIASSGRNGRQGALLYIDLDNFKVLNETLGHDFGDLLLQQVAQRLETCIRQGDTVARLGGDEFMVMLEDLSEHSIEAAEQTEAVGEKILTQLNQSYQLASREYRNSTSIGATLFKGHERGIDDLFKQADIALYQAKSAGRNTLRFFDQQMQDTINSRAALESELYKALENQQLHLYYQIQVGNSNNPLGAEALIRWIHPERGLVSPAQFIPLAEETGLIVPIGQWVLETACAQLKAWQRNIPTQNFTLAVNVSAKQFRQVDFVTQVESLVQRYAINPILLKLELTESMLLDKVEDTIATMNALKAIGVQISLDDFGTGYSSLQYLKRLPLDQLKIDQSFVRDIVSDNSDRAIVRTIIAMARGLNLNYIAEGVETDEQRQILLNMGCSHYQGYLFGKPAPIEQFEALLKQG